MGAMKEKKIAKQAGSRRVRRQVDGVADWETADGNLLRRAIGIVGKQGGALRLGYTSDGGAYAVGVYGDGEPYTDYIRPSEDIDDYLRAVIESWETP